MTKSELKEELDDYDALIRYCEGNDIDVLGDVMDDDDYWRRIDDDIIDAIRYDSWQEVRDRLNNLADSSETEHFRRNGNLDYDPLDLDNFDDDRDMVIEEAFSAGLITDDNGDTYDDAARKAMEEYEREQMEIVRLKREQDRKIVEDFMDFLGL